MVVSDSFIIKILFNVHNHGKIFWKRRKKPWIERPRSALISEIDNDLTKNARRFDVDTPRGSLQKNGLFSPRTKYVQGFRGLTFRKSSSFIRFPLKLRPKIDTFYASANRRLCFRKTLPCFAFAHGWDDSQYHVEYGKSRVEMPPVDIINRTTLNRQTHRK